MDFKDEQNLDQTLDSPNPCKKLVKTRQFPFKELSWSVRSGPKDKGQPKIPVILEDFTEDNQVD